jgi:mannosyltransferase
VGCVNANRVTSYVVFIYREFTEPAATRGTSDTAKVLATLVSSHRRRGLYLNAPLRRPSAVADIDPRTNSVSIQHTSRSPRSIPVRGSSCRTRLASTEALVGMARESIWGASVQAFPLTVARVRLVDGTDLRAPGRRSRAAAVVGLVAFAISLVGSWIPSYWSDEVATLRAARLSWQELFAFVAHKDAVHAAYYSLLKLWAGMFGESELATRSLSALAIGAAAAGLVVLVTSMTSLRIAVMAGVIFALLPRTTSMGIEARSFALSATIAVWATIVLLVATRTGDWRWWALYAVIIAAGTYVFLYSVLILAAHLVFLILEYRVRRVLAPWLLAASGAVVAALPMLILSVQQKEQIAWLADLPVVTMWTILGKPAFDSSWLVAAIAWCALLVLAFRCRTIWSGPQGSTFRLAAAWFSVPLVLLLTADPIVGPLYNARYLSFIAPAVAVLLAIALTLPSRSTVAWALVGALVVASAPTYVAQRGPFAKDGGSDLSQIAGYIHSHAIPGDGIYLQDTGKATLRPRLALYAYPAAFTGTEDVAFEAPFTTTGTFSDQTRSLDEIEPKLAGINRIFVVTAGSSDTDAARKADAALQSMEFFGTSSYKTNRSVVTLYER